MFMKAAAITPGKKDSIKVVELPEPPLDDDTVLVSMLEAGVCGTDEELNSGIIGEAPAGSDFLIIGHENLGRVASVGKNVRYPRVGDLVVATVRRPCPGRCYACRVAEPDMCSSGDYLERGIKGMHGYMAEYYVESPEYLVQVPPELRKVAVLTEPLSIVEKAVAELFKVQERLTWRPVRALVAGAGPIGMLAAFILRDMGLETWAFATRERTSLKGRLIEMSGARYVNAKEVPMEKIARDYGPFDIIIEATGSSEIAFKSIGLVNAGGIVCLTGLSPHKAEHSVCTDCVNMDLVMNNKAVFGTSSSNRVHFERALDRMVSIEKKWPGLLERMFTRRVELTRAVEGLRRTREDVKVIVEIGGARPAAGRP
jgi:threonine dehydrogenase-like Zn-dependent dehydrogenase